MRFIIIVAIVTPKKIQSPNLFDLNNAILNITISRLKNEKPDISENELIKELKKIFRVDFNEKI